MLSLKHFRDTVKGVADLLNWAALVDSGVVQGKDGSLLVAYSYQGPDLGSASADELNYLTDRVNVALSKLGSGWVTWHEAIRTATRGYPERDRSHFPDRISAIVDEERRAAFEAEGGHFQSMYVVVFVYTPPIRAKSRVVDLMYDDDTGSTKSVADRILAGFKKALADLEDTLLSVVKLQRLAGYEVTDEFGRTHYRDDLLNFLNLCLTGENIEINVPPHGMYLDAVLGVRDLWPADMPKLGEAYIAAVAIEGFPSASSPGILDVLNRLPLAYRWSTRFIYLDQHQALGELKKYQRHWKGKVRGFFSQIFQTSGGAINEDALYMAAEVDTAITAAHSNLVSFGYYTPVVVLMGRDIATLTENARYVVREIQRLGFSARVESVNAMEAWLGSLPGHAAPNIRRPPMHTLNLADLLPLSSVWAGRDVAPCPFYPPDSPPLMYAATSGSTPFRFNLHISDVGHTLVFGQTGSGKSTLLATMALQFRRYENATLCCFDKGYSMWAAVKGCGGQHYAPGKETAGLAFCPLGSLEDEGDMAWCEEWIGTLFHLQTNRQITPQQRAAIHGAMLLLKQSSRRSLTDFVATVQNVEIRDALRHYTIDGGMGHLLDAKEDNLYDSSFIVYEIEELMNMGDKNALPVLLYLFRRFEKTLKGQPALLILDEAWLMLGHPVFREKIREWLKVLRKANCAVILATQSLSDIITSAIFLTIIESCPTKILAPNEEARKTGSPSNPGPYECYKAFGLNETEIDIIKTAVKKRDYYYMSPEGRRLFHLGLGPAALAFVAVSDKEKRAQIEKLEQKFGDEWPYIWLGQNGVRHDSILV